MQANIFFKLMTSETEYEKLCDVCSHGIYTLLENYARNNMVKVRYCYWYLAYEN